MPRGPRAKIVNNSNIGGMISITTTVTIAYEKKIEDHCKNRGITKAEFVRRLMEAELGPGANLEDLK